MQEYSRRFTREYPPKLQREPGLTESTAKAILQMFLQVIQLWSVNLFESSATELGFTLEFSKFKQLFHMPGTRFSL